MARDGRHIVRFLEFRSSLARNAPRVAYALEKGKAQSVCGCGPKVGDIVAPSSGQTTPPVAFRPLCGPYAAKRALNLTFGNTFRTQPRFARACRSRGGCVAFAVASVRDQGF